VSFEVKRCDCGVIRPRTWLVGLLTFMTQNQILFLFMTHSRDPIFQHKQRRWKQPAVLTNGARPMMTLITSSGRITGE
jgi:hypothetical protein